MPQVVLKLGGSLLRAGQTQGLFNVVGELAPHHRALVVPGGGIFADAVRSASRRHTLAAEPAHWMAVLAMDQAAHLVAARLLRACLVADAAEAAAALDAGRTPVLAPFRWLRSADPLPHGWSVTSDSIAAWLAGHLEAKWLILLKAVDGVVDQTGRLLAEVPPAILQRDGLVDPYFQTAMPPGAGCWIINGQHPDRLRQLLEGGWTRGTRVRRPDQA